jgi:hypothetical protein
MRSEVPVAVDIEITIFWYVTPYSLIAQKIGRAHV